MKYVEYKKISEEVRFPRPLLPVHALRLCEHFKLSRQFKLLAFVSLAWSLASRISDLMLVKVKNVAVISSTVVRVLYVEGKGVKMRGQAYSVQGVNPFATAVAKVLRHLDPDDRPFASVSRTTLRDTMRKFHKDYELRSFRRGALQHMASQGTTLEVLRTISGHASDATLLRYLHWGWTAQCVQEPQVEATETLWPVESHH
jgi:integrase